jgi:hypothetical protein
MGKTLQKKIVRKIYYKQKQVSSADQRYAKTIDYIISECSILAKGQYRKRHKRRRTELQFIISKEIWENQTKRPGLNTYKTSRNIHEGKVNVLPNKLVKLTNQSLTTKPAS